MGLGLSHRPIGEVHQHDDDADGAAQRRAVRGGAANDAERRAEGVLISRDDQTVVQSGTDRLHGAREGAERRSRGCPDGFKLLLDSLLEFRRGCDGTSQSVFTRLGRLADLGIVTEDLAFRFHSCFPRTRFSEQSELNVLLVSNTCQWKNLRIRICRVDGPIPSVRRVMQDCAGFIQGVV